MPRIVVQWYPKKTFCVNSNTVFFQVCQASWVFKDRPAFGLPRRPDEGRGQRDEDHSPRLDGRAGERSEQVRPSQEHQTAAAATTAARRIEGRNEPNDGFGVGGTVDAIKNKFATFFISSRLKITKPWQLLVVFVMLKWWKDVKTWTLTLRIWSRC